MKLHEYQAKKLFADYGIPVPKGIVASTPEEAKAAALELGEPCVIKSQVLVGGRGKAGGIKFADTPDEAADRTKELIGFKIKTETVEKVLIEQKIDIAQELYLSVTIDPTLSSPIVMASASGGMEIEEIAATQPDKLIIEPVNIFKGLGAYKARDIFYRLGLTKDQVNAATGLLLKLYKIFREKDAELVEINPLVITKDGNIIAADGKVMIYDSALYRQKQFTKGREQYSDDREYTAAQYGLGYVKLDGNIGVLCTGAGLTMTTLDVIAHYGGKAANFLEFGGATYKNAYYALEIVLTDPDVKVILINTFGLVARADVIAKGLAEAILALKPQIPIVIAIRGTGEEEARKIMFEKCGLVSLADTEEAVKKAIEIARG